MAQISTPEDRLGDNIGHGVADLLVDRSDRTRQADGEPKDHSQVASRRNEGGCHAGHLFACGLVNPITNWKTMKQNGTMAKARQNQCTSKSSG